MLRKVRAAEQMSKEKTIWMGEETKDTEKKIRHLIDVISGQHMIMSGVAQSSSALWTPAQYRQLVNTERFLIPRPYIFPKFNPLNTDTPLIRTLSNVPSVSVLTGFDYIGLRSCQYTDKSL